MTASGAMSWSVSEVANAKPHERKTGAVCDMVFLKMDMRECRAWAGAADGASTRLLAHESKDKYQLRFLDLNQAGCAAVCNPVHLALVRVNYPDRPATTILAGGGGGIFG